MFRLTFSLEEGWFDLVGLSIGLEEAKSILLRLTFSLEEGWFDLVGLSIGLEEAKSILFRLILGSGSALKGLNLSCSGSHLA